MLDKYGVVFENADLKDYTTYKISSICKYLIKPDSIDNLVNLIRYLDEQNIKYFILGNGSNVIFKNNYFEGIIIKLDLLNKYQIDKENLILDVQTGVYLPMLSNTLAKEGFSIFEWALGLPGEIGGSIYGNAEAYKHPISEKLIDVTIFKDNEIKVLKKEDIKFGYRTSEFKEGNNAIILSARFKLEIGNTDEMLELMKDRQMRRLNTQPLDYPSAGSTFRNPHKNDYDEIFKKYDLKVNEDGYVPAGYLIEHAGLKGTRIGGAMISDKHANFIINKDNASSDDVINLINLVKEEIKKKYEINLVLEQEIIDFDK